MASSEFGHAPQPIERAGAWGGRSPRLREFQTRLVERMQAARSGAETQDNRLGVIAGGTGWLIKLREAGEMAPVGAITTVPLTHDWFLGLANVRGNLINVIDFSRFLGRAATEIDKDARIVAFAPQLSFNSALLVSRVAGLRNLSQMKEQDGAASNSRLPWVARRFTDQGGQLWCELDFSLAVQDQRFLQIGK